MPKKYFQWEVNIWCGVYHLQDTVWVWSHNSTRTYLYRAETEDEVRQMVLPTLQPEVIDIPNKIKVTKQSIYAIRCRGEMRKVTEWQVVDKDARPSYKRRK